MLVSNHTKIVQEKQNNLHLVDLEVLDAQDIVLQNTVFRVDAFAAQFQSEGVFFVFVPATGILELL